ncbi:Lacto-N-biose phosphorylase, partial [human gut metagenome]
LECLSGMPFEVEFISFDDVRNGIPEEIKVIINVGDAYTAFSGAENWIDEKVLTNIRRFVDQGGGFIGVGEPTAYQYQGRYFQLSDVLGVDREMCFSLSTDKYNEKNDDHFILEDIEGALDFGRAPAASMHRADIIRSLRWMGNTASWWSMNMAEDTAYILQVFRILPRTAGFCLGQSIMQPAWSRR